MAGVKAGSIAAFWQATMGGTIAAGSKFAILQSVAATGGLAILGLPGIIGTAVGGGAYIAYNYFF